MKIWLIFFCCFTIGCVIGVPAAQSIPLFARREKMQCQKCHFRVPELKEDGHAYARRGLREEPPGTMGNMKEQGNTEIAGMQKEMPSDASDTMTPHKLGQPLPFQWGDFLTVMGTHSLTLQKGAEPTFDAGVIDLLSAGHIGSKWSGLANPSFDIQNGVASFDQVYGQFITHWDDKFQSARFGQTLPFAILLNQGGPSMTLSTPLALSTMPDTGTSWTPATLMRGLEIGAVNTPRWNAYLGAGQPHLDSSPAGSEANTDIYASAEYLLGKNDTSITLYGYNGHAWLSPVATKQGFHRIGVFGNAYWPKTKAVAGYLVGSDKDASNHSLDSSGYFLLGEQLLSERWSAYARYDHMRQDLAAGGSQSTWGPTLGVSWWAQTQVRLTLEAQLLKTTGQQENGLLMAELMWLL